RQDTRPVRFHTPFDFVVGERLPPGGLQAADIGPIATGHIDHAAAEVARDADQHTVARLDDVGEGGFHRRTARAADGDGVLVIRLPRIAQQLTHFVHHLDEGRIEMAHGRRDHRGEYARMGVRWPGPQQNPRRHIDRRQVYPVIVIDWEGVYTHVCPRFPCGEYWHNRRTFML